MVAKISCEEAIAIKALNQRIVDIVNERRMGMDLPTILVAMTIVVDAIQEIGEVMGRPTVRGHDDPNIRFPVVDNHSSWKAILQRLRRQVRAARRLADMSHNGPPANDDEIDALYQVKQTLERTFERFSLATSHYVHSDEDFAPFQFNENLHESARAFRTRPALYESACSKTKKFAKSSCG